MAIRLALLAHHYKSDWEWTDEELARAQARLDRWRAAVARDRGPGRRRRRPDVLATVRERLADDLDAPGALAAIDAWADAALAGARAAPDGRGRGTRRLSATPPTRCSAWPCNPARPLPTISHPVKQHFPVAVDFRPVIHSSHSLAFIFASAPPQAVPMTHNPSPTAQPKHSAPAGSSPGRAAAVRPGANPPDARTPQQRVRIGSPLTLLAVVPGLTRVPARPTASSCIGTGQPRRRGRAHAQVRPARSGCPASGRRDRRRACSSILTAQRITTAAAVGYGADGAVSPVAAALRSRAAEAGITLTEVLRAEDNRYWSYVCANPECCPPEGTPFDVADHPVTRAFAASGRRVLASREELAATIAPADGEPATAMRRATRQAERQVAARVGRMTRAGHRIARRRLVAAVGPADGRRGHPPLPGGRDDRPRARRLAHRRAARAAGARRCLGADAARAQRRAHPALGRPDPAGAARVRGRPGVAAGLRRLAGRATARSPTSPSTARWPTTGATPWPGCCAGRSTPARRRRWPGCR